MVDGGWLMVERLLSRRGACERLGIGKRGLVDGGWWMVVGGAIAKLAGSM